MKRRQYVDWDITARLSRLK